jgi:catechol 2,3-dioxygenase-like lactoylglutathione lyase family enzyme
VDASWEAMKDTVDLDRAREFYGETLGLRTSPVEEMPGLMTLHLAGDRATLVYEKQDHVPATYTILNFPVEDIDQAVEELEHLIRRPCPGFERGGFGLRDNHQAGCQITIWAFPRPAPATAPLGLLEGGVPEVAAITAQGRLHRLGIG